MRLLIVEDDATLCDALKLHLSKEGYYIDICQSGSDAEYYFRDCAYGAIILDRMLPGMDGFELMGYMKHYDIPIIYLTAKSDIDSKIQGLRDGAEDYIVKPFEILELLVRIEKVLERRGKMKQVLTAAGFDINLLERSVRKNGEEIILKPMEFDLLVMLAKNKNIALSRERLLHGVWGVDFIGETRTVDVHIGQLRKKLDLAENIRTISKMGYRLED